MRRPALTVAVPLTVLTVLGFASVVLVGAVGGASPSGRSLPPPGSCGSVTGSAAGLDPAQEVNATIITSVALGRGLGPVGAGIGVAVALAESSLFNDANDGTSTLVGSAEGRQLTDAERAVARESLAFPHDRVGNNLDSIGLFQQRPMTGWGTPAQLIDPATAAGLFFDRLQQVPGWEALPPWQAGQLVQGSPSTDGGIYRGMYTRAVGIVTALMGPTPVAAQPVAAASAATACRVGGSGGDQPALVANTSAGGGGGSAGWGGFENGRIPASALCPVPTMPALLLECTAATAFDRLNTAFRGVFGQDIGITDAYRSFDEQVACRAEKGTLCADPGTSNHGWAKAVDIGACCGINGGAGPVVRLAHRQRGRVRVGPPRVGPTKRVETRSVALGIRGHLMTWAPGNGTEAISSWLNQGVIFALVLAVAAVIGCAVVWAAGSLAGNGAAAGRGRTGIVVALAGALLLGAGYGYLQWVSSTQAPAFAGDPAEYGITGTPDIPGAWQFLDLSQRWTSDINTVRTKDGLPPLRTDTALTDKARSCASSRAGQGGDCPVNTLGCAENRGMLYGAWDYGPGDLDKLSGDLSEDLIRDPNPWGGESIPVALDPSVDMRTAWVALEDTANQRAVVVGMFENGAGLAVWNKCVQFG